MTSMPPKSCRSRCWTGVYGSMTPSSGRPSANPAANCAPGFFFSRTIGRWEPVSSASSASFTSQTARTSSNVGAMTANAFPSRRLRSRSRAMASAFDASHARWKPPRPFTATILPARSASTARAKHASLSSRVRPHATGTPAMRPGRAAKLAPSPEASSAAEPSTAAAEEAAASAVSPSGRAAK